MATIPFSFDWLYNWNQIFLLIFYIVLWRLKLVNIKQFSYFLSGKKVNIFSYPYRSDPPTAGCIWCQCICMLHNKVHLPLIRLLIQELCSSVVICHFLNNFYQSLVAYGQGYPVFFDVVLFGYNRHPPVSLQRQIVRWYTARRKD
jgi:hypothetical protein